MRINKMLLNKKSINRQLDIINRIFLILILFLLFFQLINYVYSFPNEISFENSFIYIKDENKADLITHNPIMINGNQNFLNRALNESWPGEGTKSNPIIIENLNITSSATEHMITIWNTDLTFIIQGCVLNGIDGLSKTYGDGIWLNSVKNGIIRGNEIFSNKMGVSLEPNNENILIEGNSIYNNAASGIHSHQSRNITITKNDIFQNIQSGSDYISLGDGIEMSESSNLKIFENNIFQNDHYGIALRTCEGVNCSRNIIYDNTLGISLSTNSNYNNFTFNVITNHSNYAVTLSASCLNNIVKYNNFITNGASKSSQAYDNGELNIFIFNYWNEWIEPDLNNDTIVDDEYYIDGLKNNSDRYALTISVFEVINLELFTTIPVSSSKTVSSTIGLDSELLFPILMSSLGILSLYRRKKF